MDLLEAENMETTGSRPLSLGPVPTEIAIRREYL
jgi:hypothetical protein